MMQVLVGGRLVHPREAIGPRPAGAWLRSRDARGRVRRCPPRQRSVAARAGRDAALRARAPGGRQLAARRGLPRAAARTASTCCSIRAATSRAEGADALPDDAILRADDPALRRAAADGRPPIRTSRLLRRAGAVFAIDQRAVVALRDSGIRARLVRPGYTRMPRPLRSRRRPPDRRAVPRRARAAPDALPRPGRARPGPSELRRAASPSPSRARANRVVARQTPRWPLLEQTKVVHQPPSAATTTRLEWRSRARRHPRRRRRGDRALQRDRAAGRRRAPAGRVGRCAAVRRRGARCATRSGWRSCGRGVRAAEHLAPVRAPGVGAAGGDRRAGGGAGPAGGRSVAGASGRRDARSLQS